MSLGGSAIKTAKKRKAKAKISSAHAKARARIVHPALIEAFDADHYYPWFPEEWPEEDRNHPLVKKAIKEGWAEWIESQVDLEAVKEGFVYDLSRDKQGRVVYWHKGSWQRYEGRGRNRQLLKIPIELESQEIGYFGRGDHFTRFAESFLTHTKAPLAGDPYRFIHWQRKLGLTLFGWIVHTEDKKGKPARYRRFARAYVSMAKKNAKSDLGSIISVYLISADHEVKAEVYGTANDKNQARIVFREARDYVKSSPELSEVILIHDSKTESRLSHYESGSFYEVVAAANASSNDGYDAHGVIFDEIHHQPNSKQYRIFEPSGQARAQPLEFVCTTYGATLSSIWGEVHLKSKDVLQGMTLDTTKYVMICSAEEITVTVAATARKGATTIEVGRLEQPVDVGEVITFKSAAGGDDVEVVLTQPAKRFQRFLEVEPLADKLTRYSSGQANGNPLARSRIDHAICRANPSIGIILSLRRVRADILDARTEDAIADKKRKLLNLIAAGGSVWIPAAAWRSCGRRRIRPGTLVDKRCIGGLDISNRNDLTAFWLAFPNWKAGKDFGKVKKPKVRLLGLVWVPDDQIEARERAEGIAYRSLAEANYFAEFGYVRITEGTTINYRQVGEDIIKFCSYFNVEMIGFDGNISQFVVDPYLIPAGLNCVVHRQGIGMSQPSQRFENMVCQHQIEHGNHPVLDAAVANCILKVSSDVGNSYPSKSHSLARVDPLVSAIMANGLSCNPLEGMRESGAWSQAEGTGIWG